MHNFIFSPFLKKSYQIKFRCPVNEISEKVKKHISERKRVKISFHFFNSIEKDTHASPPSHNKPHSPTHPPPPPNFIIIMSDCGCPEVKKPKCCPPPKKDVCPPPIPAPCNLPQTLTFTCPADECKPKPKPFCPEKKKEGCTCVGGSFSCDKKDNCK